MLDQVSGSGRAPDGAVLYSERLLSRAATLHLLEAEVRRSGQNVQSAPDLRHAQYRRAAAALGIEYA
jgi:hypothetical protein